MDDETDRMRRQVEQQWQVQLKQGAAMQEVASVLRESILGLGVPPVLLREFELNAIDRALHDAMVRTMEARAQDLEDMLGG